MSAAWPGIMALAGRELRRFWRQRGRFSGAIGTPLVCWAVLGAGFGAAVSAPEAAAEGYTLYFYPGAIVLTTLFTAVFATISVIEDRRGGILLAALASPLPRWGIALGVVAGGSTVALLNAALFLAPARWLGIPLGPGGYAAATAILALLAIAFTSLGFAVAWRLDTPQGFHAFMNLVLVPLWLLSGAVFPPSTSAAWMRWVLAFNPVTYGVVALRQIFNAPWAAGGTGSGVLEINVGITAAFAALCFAAAWLAVPRREVA